MPRPQSKADGHPATATRADLHGILGDLDDGKAIEILALKPTVADVEEAAIYATGDGDVLAKGGHPCSHLAADIIEILTADEEEPPPVQ